MGAINEFKHNHRDLFDGCCIFLWLLGIIAIIGACFALMVIYPILLGLVIGLIIAAYKDDIRGFCIY